MSTVYVLNKDGKPLMPTTRCGHVRHLLKEQKARVVTSKSFTIQLLYETDNVVQPLYLGIDPGRTNIGVAVVNLNAAGNAPVTVIPVIAMLRNTPQDYFGQNLEVIPWRTIVQHLLSEDDKQCVRFVLRKWEAANPEEAAFGNPLGYKDVSRRRYAEKLDSIAMTYCLYGDLENILPREFSIAQI